MIYNILQKAEEIAMGSRQSNLVDVVNRYGKITIHELKAIFNDVSEMTIRRDIETLEKEGKLIRIHGGAKSLNTIFRDDLYEAREVSNIEKKKLIAKKAAGLIGIGDTVYIDGGTTATELCKILPDINIRVYTDNIIGATLMSYAHNISTMLLGGIIDPCDMCTRHSSPESCWVDVNFNYIFLGATGYSESSGFTSGNDKAEYLLKKNIMGKTDKTVILMDSTKIGKSSCYTFARPADVDIVISDGELPKEIVDRFTAEGIVIM